VRGNAGTKIKERVGKLFGGILPLLPLQKIGERRWKTVRDMGESEEDRDQ